MSCFRGGSLQHQLFASAAIVASVAVASPACAQTRTFNLPAQAAETGIPAFAKQAGIQILASADTVRGKRTKAVRGSYTAEEGLRRLLEGTGLTSGSGVNGTGIITIRPVNGNAQGATSQRVPPAAKEAPAPGETPGSAEVEARGAQPDNTEIVVTGTNIRGVTNLAAPSTVMTRKEFERAGFTNLAEAFRNLPQNFPGISHGGRLANEGGSELARANREGVDAIDLRGLGAESTLVLVNGQRRALTQEGRTFNLGSVPLSVIDRVEIVTGGRSSIYGSDAVAGVVNIVTRRSFDGVDARASYGAPTEHPRGRRFAASSTAGFETEQGGMLLSYAFTRDQELNLVDTGFVNSPIPGSNIVTIRRDVQIPLHQHTLMMAGHYEPTTGLEVFSDASYTHRTIRNIEINRRPNALTDSNVRAQDDSSYYNISPGAKVTIGRWQGTAQGVYSQISNDFSSQNYFDFGTSVFSQNFTEKTQSTVSGASLIAEGPLNILQGISPRLAFGGSWRRETFDYELLALNNLPSELVFDDVQRSIWSAFAELFIPIEGLGNRLEFSLAGRLDDYSDFGSTFNPQAGLVWEPVRGLLLRGSYSRAFRAPSLTNQGSLTFAQLINVPDPLSPTGISPVLARGGDNNVLGPERANTWTAGFELRPVATPFLRLSGSYFRVDYQDRIDVPAPSATIFSALQNESLYSGLVNRAPTGTELLSILETISFGIFNQTGRPFDPATQQLLDVFPDLVVIDNRFNNIGSVKFRAVDLDLSIATQLAGGSFRSGVNATYVLSHQRRLTATSPASEFLNEVGKPVDFRLRAQFEWDNELFGVSGFVNYVDGYRNQFASPVGSIDSWTTIDVSMRAHLDRIIGGPLRDVTAILTFNNVLNQAPPAFLSNTAFGNRYDPANSNPIGRFVTFQLLTRF